VTHAYAAVTHPVKSANSFFSNLYHHPLRATVSLAGTAAISVGMTSVGGAMGRFLHLGKTNMLPTFSNYYLGTAVKVCECSVEASCRQPWATYGAYTTGVSTFAGEVTNEIDSNDKQNFTTTQSATLKSSGSFTPTSTHSLLGKRPREMDTDQIQQEENLLQERVRRKL
jgi:hypothetical protein